MPRGINNGVVLAVLSLVGAVAHAIADDVDQGVLTKPSVASVSEAFGAPSTVFKNVNASGGVSLFDVVGNFAASDGVTIPIAISFDSTSNVVSPYLGFGWTIPLLESRAVMESPKILSFFLPEGTRLYLGLSKDQTKPGIQTFISADDEWKATISDDAITLVAPTGWILTYDKGHLTKIDLGDGNSITITYTDQSATAYYNSSVILTASQQMHKEGQLQIGDTQLKLSFMDRPVVDLTPEVGQIKSVVPPGC